MNKVTIKKNLIKKINDFLKKSKSLKYLDPSIFENIDKYKKIKDIDFNNYYLECIKKIPKLDTNSAIKISREVYKLYGKEKDFDRILKQLIDDHNIFPGSFNESDFNCIIKASESRIFLSGTYNDVVVLCHEIGHKLIYNNSKNTDYVMDNILFEVPSTIFEFAATDYLKDYYNIDINTYELRKEHVLSMSKDTNLESDAFSIITRLMKERKLNILNLYKEIANNKKIVEFLNAPSNYIEDYVDNGISNYYYDIGYILASYTINSDNKIELLNMFLKYKDDGINAPFTIDEKIIKEAFGSKKHTR
ncbi:MAG: hypothetical protein IKF19_02385 [Bacilli bacterium]|nr:hypothetical protein [Bacilli bacterium]